MEVMDTEEPIEILTILLESLWVNRGQINAKLCEMIKSQIEFKEETLSSISENWLEQVKMVLELSRKP